MVRKIHRCWKGGMGELKEMCEKGGRERKRKGGVREIDAENGLKAKGPRELGAEELAVETPFRAV